MSILVYFSIFLLPLFLYFFRLVTSHKRSVFLGFLFLYVLFISIVFGFRYDVGTDYFNYQYIYEALATNSHHHHDRYLYELEPGYVFLNLLFSGLDNGYTYLNFSLSLIFFFTVLYSFISFSRFNNKSGFLFRNKNESLLILSIVVFFGLGFGFAFANTTRQSMSCAIFMLSIVHSLADRRKLSIFYFFISLLFHYSTIVAIPVLFILNMRLSVRVCRILMTFVFILSLLLKYVNFDSILISFVQDVIGFKSYYLSDNYLDNIQLHGLGLRGYIEMVIYYVLFVIFPVKNHRIRVLSLAFFFVVCMQFVLFSLGNLTRIFYSVYFLGCIVLPITIVSVEKQFNRYLLVTIFGLIMFFFFLRVVFSDQYLPYQLAI